MNIAVLSGKGGTGKTTLSTNLAPLLGASYIDCDVEAPNGFLFLQPQNIVSTPVEVLNPKIDDERCLHCGRCARVCQFHALAQLPKEILFFPQLCHSCGACQLACAAGAISEERRSIGQIEVGQWAGGTCMRGLLQIGEPFAVPVIKRLLQGLTTEYNILDAPPGTSCNVVQVLLKADAVLLIVEPTPFGLHDFKLALQLVQQFQLPYGVIINKKTGGRDEFEQWCEQEKIPIMGSIPYSKEAAATYAQGKLLLTLDTYKTIFQELAQQIQEGWGWN